ncbi:MAG: hypothetical protein ACE5G9_08220 [Nitrospinales bacterium]
MRTRRLRFAAGVTEVFVYSVLPDKLPLRCENKYRGMIVLRQAQDDNLAVTLSLSKRELEM